MSDDGTSFTIDIPVTGGAQIDAAAKSTEVLAAHLDAASKASIAASDGIKASEASYRKAESAADSAAKALERVGLAADVQRAKLRAASDANDGKGAEKAAAKLRELVVEQDVLAQRCARRRRRPPSTQKQRRSTSCAPTRASPRPKRPATRAARSSLLPSRAASAISADRSPRSVAALPRSARD